MPTWPNKSLETYLAALSDPDSRMRQQAAAALGRLRDLRAVEPLIARLAADESADVRATAAQALGKLNDLRAVEPLIAALGDPEGSVREYAVLALESLGDPRAAPAIFPLIEDLDTSVRYHATRVAAKLGGARAVEPLMRELRAPTHPLYDPNFGDSSVSAALAIIGAPARAPLLAALQDPDAGLRARAAASLYGLRDDEVLAALRVATQDPNPRVSQAARSTLETIHNGIAYERDVAQRAGAQPAPAPQPPQQAEPPAHATMPTRVFDWAGLMTPWNTELLADDHVRVTLSPEVIAAGWLGYPGATEEQIAALENRLGATLPPSYRAFLAYTNGWRATGHFIPAVWSAEEVEWHAVRHQDLIDAWLDGERYGGGPIPISDEEYLDYSGEHGAAGDQFRSAYLETALEVSEPEIAGSAMYLLNPQIITPEGEWEAWLFAAWLGGAVRYRSFWEMMVAERQGYLALRDNN